MKKKGDRKKLRVWQERLKTNEAAYQNELDKMGWREELYRGSHELKDIVEIQRKHKTPHVRNICAELIEAQVDTNIPQPKVTARRKKDEDKAKLIEDMIRNELDRMPFEQLNDMMERTVPIQGGAAFLLEWDSTQRTHYTIGELAVSLLHPKQIIPQDGVFGGIESMDYVILKIPQTKEFIRRRYDVDLEDETEREPGVKGKEEVAEDLVTQYIAYYRNESGGIGLYSWVNDVELEDLPDYQARRLRHCKHCGAVEPQSDEPIAPPPEVGGSELMGVVEGISLPFPNAVSMGFSGAAGKDAPAERRRGGRKECPYCHGTEWEESSEETEELYYPIMRSDGSIIGGMVERREIEIGTDGLPVETVYQEPMKIPLYKPNVFPVILQKNVSVYGKLLGDSDIDAVADQQNTINRIEAKIIDKLVKSGSYISLPTDAKIEKDDEDMKIIYPHTPASKAMIDVYNMEADISQDMAYLSQIYEESRQREGITDSFQGRKDTTATSGKAKEFSAAQAAGRLESKRVMKNAAYAALFESIFKFKLAYTDEPRPVVSEDIHGNPQYQEFNRYDFLEQDAAGEWCWNDQFLFSCDTSAPLANNREAMWQETRMNLQSGAFGDPTQLTTLILFWTKMEGLHYPLAGETKAYLEEELKRQQMAAKMQQQMMEGQAQQQAGAAAGNNGQLGMSNEQLGV